jgi:predicted RNA-binding Zn-ribbon protein involved in translation (DUF1610 family)
MTRGIYNPESHTCPSCGNKKSSSSKQCRKCNYKNRAQEKIVARTCPECGGKKAWGSDVCMSCASNKRKIYQKPGWDRSDDFERGKSIDWSVITDEWAYQFAGLFYGEGTITLKRTNQGTVVATMSMHLRADDVGVLKDIQLKLGGSIRLNNRPSNVTKSHPTYKWETVRTKQVYEIVCLLEKYAIIPAKKLNDIRIVRKFIEWRLNQPFQGGIDWEYAEQLVKELRAAREFVPPTD